MKKLVKEILNSWVFYFFMICIISMIIMSRYTKNIDVKKSFIYLKVDSVNVETRWDPVIQNQSKPIYVTHMSKDTINITISNSIPKYKIGDSIPAQVDSVYEDNKFKYRYLFITY